VEYSGNIIKSLYDPLIYLSLFLLVVALSLWFISASQIEFSVLIPASLITIVISSVIGFFIFSEEISLRKIFAYILIAIGVLVLTFSKSNDNNQNTLTNNKISKVKVK
jgi:drug/metabolite transporter (DMT)-like permease